MTLLVSSPDAPVRGGVRPVFDLAGPGHAVALHTDDGPVTYAQLADRAARLAAEVLGPGRRLVLVEGANHPDAVVAYLAAVQHGHVALLVPDGRAEVLDGMVDAYDPDVVLRQTERGWAARERRNGSAHDLHPDLALLLSTSGSTGSPKLVRLSHDNLRSNAESIATYLGLTEHDRAITSLPLHYCYGLSVLNSHLVRGASLVVTGLSVVDDCFWQRFTETGATSFAGVPYTFDLLEHSGFAGRDLPTLRYVTQAGGRLAPDRVRRYAALGRERGWDLVVMYGQTEATARMAWLPPHLAEERPEAIGVPVPGGSFRLEPVPGADPDTGELVYSGPNVMLGYAQHPEDLALGRTTTELRTGDLARCRDGVWEVVGRRSRQAKVFGLRLDLDRLEATLGRDVHCLATDDVLHVVTTRRRAAARLRELAARSCGLPSSAVRVSVLAAVPRTPTGKPDLAALQRHVLHATKAPAAAGQPVTAELLRAEYAVVLGRPDATADDTFVGLGGDSLSYVELATRLGDRLGDLPRDWHTRTIDVLAAAPDRRPRWGVRTDATVLLRALAIVLVVGTHANLFTVVGGAHLLLVLAGYNLARFQLGDVPRRDRVRHLLSSAAQVLVPSAVVIAGVAVATGQYELPSALMLNGLVGSDTWTDDWQFWFLEALVWATLATAALVAVPAVDRWERRRPLAFAWLLLAITLTVRFAWTGIEAGTTERYTAGVVACFVVLGWVAARCRTHAQRAGLLLVAAAATAGFFGDPAREALVVAGVAAVLWWHSVRLPRALAPVVTTFAASSLYVYLTHWQVYPHLEVDHPALATLASFGVGLVAWLACGPLVRRIGASLRSRAAGNP